MPGELWQAGLKRKMTPLDFLYFVMLGSIVTGFVTYHNRSGWLKLLPWFLLLMLLFELYAKYLSVNNKPTMALYDVVTFIEFMYFAVLYALWAKSRFNKWLSGLLIGCFILSELLFIMHVPWVKFVDYNILSYFLSSLFLIVIAMSYLLEALRSDDIINFNKNPVIWISLGLMLYLSSASFFLVANYFEIVFKHQQVIHISITFLSVLSLYTCLTIALLCRRYD